MNVRRLLYQLCLPQPLTSWVMLHEPYLTLLSAVVHVTIAFVKVFSFSKTFDKIDDLFVVKANFNNVLHSV